MDVHESLVSSLVSCSVLVAGNIVLIMANVGDMATAGVDVAAVLKHERSMVV